MKLFPLVMLLLGAGLAATAAAGSDHALFDPQRFVVKGARLGDAEEMLLQWLGEHPEDGEARFMAARVLFWQGKHAQALVHYDRLLRDAPEHSEYLLGKALALARSGRAAAALPLLEKACALRPEDEGAWRLHIETLLAAGGVERLERARSIRDEARRRFPDADWTFPELSGDASALIGERTAFIAPQGLRLGARSVL